MLDKIVWGDIRVIDLAIAVSVLIISVIAAKTLTLYLKRILKEQVTKDHLQLIGKERN